MEKKPQDGVSDTQNLTKELPFDPNSPKTITVTKAGGTEESITIREWLIRLNTNGRGGT